MALNALIREGTTALSSVDLTIPRVKPLSSCSLRDSRITRLFLKSILLPQDKLVMEQMHLDNTLQLTLELSLEAPADSITYSFSSSY